MKLMDIIAEEAYKKKVGILTNAGGMNITACVDKLKEMVEGKGLRGYKIGYVLGDDLLDRIPELAAEGIKFENMDGIGCFDDIKDKIVNANVYYGREPIMDCLGMGADTVLTGRAADSALFLAPLAYRMGWKDGDWDNLARGIMAGHLLECGGQGAGGNFQYDWRSVPDMDQLGFPIAKVSDDDLSSPKRLTAEGSSAVRVYLNSSFTRCTTLQTTSPPMSPLTSAVPRSQMSVKTKCA